jgi:hypothetical protein
MEAEMPTIAEQEARKEAPVRIVDEAKAPKSAAFLRTWTSGYLAGFKKALELASEEIDSSTGPTGAWLDSPKAVGAAIRNLDK